MTPLDCDPRTLKLHDFGGIEVTVGRFRQALPRHSHDGLMLSLINDGVQVVRSRGGSNAASAGAIVAVAPNEVHAADPGDQSGWFYHTVMIPCSVLETRQCNSSRFYCETTIVDRSLLGALKSFFRSLQGSATIVREQTLLDLLTQFYVGHTRMPQRENYKPTEVRAVETCKEYLAAYLDRNVSLLELSRLARIDRYLLVRSFTHIVGMPPHAWHSQRRLSKCLEMLSRGHPVADVAQATGFADQAHLTRAFKRVTGIAPGKFRKDHLHFEAQRSEAHLSSKLLLSDI
jgi:AraC-like DNA-binding protein